MDVLVNVAEMWVLIARAGAIAMALYLLFGLWSARASLDEPPEHLAAYGAPKALRPVLTSILFSSALLLVWPPTAFVVAGAMAELSLRSQRGRAGGRAVELPAEGELALSVWRLFGWTAFGLVPVSLPAWLAPEAAPLRTLVAFSTVLGAWAALRGGPTPYPHAAEL
ncbi:MAG TPA: hypothetical protein PKA64_00635, partial [Myxococcota bacterium]|nr:hypothetical protein [Myxococcota bacterium]